MSASSGPASACLAQAMRREANGYDLLRLVLASAVIYSHAYAIQPVPARLDPLAAWLPSGSTGNLAVSVFFVLSGLFVTDSLLNRSGLRRFVIMRCCRVLPGLFVCLAASALVVGPVLTELPIGAYVRRPETVSYIYRNLALTDLQWRLPGVLGSHEFGLNGSLWTLPVEVRLYGAVAVLHLIGSLDRRHAATWAILLGVCAYRYFDQPADQAVFRLVLAFALGALLAVHKMAVRLSFGIAGALATAALALVWLKVAELASLTLFACDAALAYVLLIVFSRPALTRLRLPGDYSYGVYIYGFVAGQVFARLFPAAVPLANAACAIAASWLIGALSWWLVERPALDFGRALDRAVTERRWTGWRRAPAVAVAAGLLLAPLALQALPPLRPASITGFGPEVVRHGEPFNVQPGGGSAIWVRASRGLLPGTRLVIGGVTLDSTVSGSLITASVPATLFASAGRRELGLVEPGFDQMSPGVLVLWDVQ